MIHPVICVGRQLGSGGHAIAQKLADIFGFRFFDKEILNLAAKESGFSEKLFEENDEHRKWLLSRFHLRIPHISDGDFYRNQLSQENLFQFQSDAIEKAAQEQACVFVGRAADYVLRNREQTYTLFITADMEERVRRVAERRGCSDDEARHVIQHGEGRRANFYNYYTGKRWGHAESYDLCISSSHLGIDGTALWIADYLRKRMALTPNTQRP